MPHDDAGHPHNDDTAIGDPDVSDCIDEAAVNCYNNTPPLVTGSSLLVVIKCLYLPRTYLHFMQDKIGAYY
jgi:hypothetical protein